MVSGKFFNFTDKQAAIYYEIISCIDLIKRKPDVVNINKYRIFLSTLIEPLVRDVIICGKVFLQWTVKEIVLRVLTIQGVSRL